MTTMLADTDRQGSIDLEVVGGGSAVWRVDNPLQKNTAPPAGRLSGREATSTQQGEDTNAVTAPAPQDLLLSRIGHAMMGSTPGAVYVTLTTLVSTVVFAALGARSGADNPSSLHLLADVLISTLGVPSAMLGACLSLRRVTAEGGELEKLGAGTTMISEAALRGLKRAHATLWVPVTIILLLALLCFVSATRIGTRSKLTGNLITEDYAIVMVCAGFMALNLGLCVFPWWLTMKVAAVLVSDNIAEAEQAIQRCSPTAPEWDAEVVPMVLGLCDETLPLLSRGWGLGVGLNFLGWWLGAAGWFCLFLESETPAAAVIIVVCMFTPLALTYDVAAASSKCDTISDVLTDKRMRGPSHDRDFEHAITRIEKILDRQNTKQGLGFVVVGRVLDMKTLGNIVASLASAALVVLPVIYSLRPERAETTANAGLGDPCALSAVEAISAVDTIRAVLSQNATCYYNISISDVLAGGM